MLRFWYRVDIEMDSRQTFDLLNIKKVEVMFSQDQQKSHSEH